MFAKMSRKEMRNISRKKGKGLWLAHMDRDHGDTTKTQLRESCSLSVLNQQHLSIVRNSKSSDNLHRVVLHVTPPASRKSTIFFNLRCIKVELSELQPCNEF
ncbi:unnamed protein product [Onchocerca ochengi]|uniref:Ovule protein n=1 Tax=Onchocerca ochengi TaxID=42157 RepID=A0A182EV92_ONCOC|nr:unnamed protein product [Onchocerca ochengi]